MKTRFFTVLLPSQILRAFVVDEQGSALVLVASLMIILLGFVGLVTDLGVLAVRYRIAQNVADSAALAAAGSIASGSNLSGATSSANYIVQSSTVPISTFTLTYLDYQKNPTMNLNQVMYVQTSIQATYATMLLQLLGIKSDSISASSMAGIAQNLLCAFCMVGNYNQTELSLIGNGNATVENGGVIVNSTAACAICATSNNGMLIASSIGVVGGWSGVGYFQPTPVNVRPVPDPLADVPVPSLSGANMGSVSTSSQQTTCLNPGVYQDIKTSGKGGFCFNPGMYIITGELDAEGGGVLSGSGVTFYFACGTSSAPTACSSGGQAGGSLTLNGNGKYVISPPSSGDYQGISIFYDRHNTSALTLTGNGDDSVSGTIYAKSAQMTLTGNGGTFTVNSLIVADSASLKGNGSVVVNFTKSQNYPRAGLPGIVQ